VHFVRTELERLQNEPVSETELKEAKARLVGNALIDEASLDGQAKQVLDIGVGGLPLDYYRTLNARFARITAADVERVARTYLQPGRLVEVYAGPDGPWSQHSL
jgi:zinc protease